MTVIVLALAVLIGVSLGMLGGGGSILAVPLLVYVAGMEPKEAIATSLLVVGVTSVAAVVGHARARRVQWRTGVIFGLAAMLGAYLGGRLGEYIPGTWLLIGFGVMMVATAIAMLRGRKPAAGGRGSHDSDHLPILMILLEGVIVGLVTGLVGAGGGFLVVPALVLLGGLPMPLAVGTSLLVIAMKSFAGLAGYLSSVQINWPLALGVTGAAVVGSLIGSVLVKRVDPDKLRQSFGWFVLLMGGVVFAQELPVMVLVPVLVGVVVLVAGVLVLSKRLDAGKDTSKDAEKPADVLAP